MIDSYMEERACSTKEEMEARDRYRSDMIRAATLAREMRETPEQFADVAPHLMGRR